MNDKTRLMFAWWNTGLSPAGRRRAKPSDLDIASEIVQLLIHSLGVDFLGLAEVASEDLSILESSVGASTYTTYDGTKRDGRVQFETGAIYNSERFVLLGEKSITAQEGNSKLKVANQLTLAVEGDLAPFNVFLSHWISQTVPNTDSRRVSLGVNLRTYVDELLAESDEVAHIILMGDYNEEPFHECIEGRLVATRDRRLAISHPTYLYNPFWRFLGESAPYSHSCSGAGFPGTCHVPCGDRTKWKTVDQIIFSSAFLGKSPWHLNENLVEVLCITPRAYKEQLQNDIFDHFPIVTVVEKKGNGDA